MCILEWPIYSNQSAFLAWVLQMSAPGRGGRCGGENDIYAGDAYLSKG